VVRSGVVINGPSEDLIGDCSLREAEVNNCWLGIVSREVGCSPRDIVEGELL
jgi:hypothetical protein